MSPAPLVVVINGSPLPRSSVSKMLAAVATGAREGGAEVARFDCYSLSVKPCIACGPDATSGYCVFHDDMDRVYAALERAHAVVAGSPVYFDTVSAPFKALIDRCNCVTPLVTLPGGGTDVVPKWERTRRGVFVTACSSNHTHELAERTVRGWMKWVGTKWQETILWQHPDDELGSVTEALLARSRDAGRELATSPPLLPGGVEPRR
ncbi:MAG: flavodoxin family protein [Candidatus Eisenbacteria bacterium]|nr:flavodoxin family protein [Candidatus Eisenbacteria bacterium]